MRVKIMSVHVRVCRSPVAIERSTATDMQEKAKARLRELAPAARGSQEAGFTQPSLHIFLHVCIY